MANDPFVLNVARMRRSIGERRAELRRGVVPELSCSGSAVPEGALCEADVTLESIVGGIAVSGLVSAPWVGECRRCLAPASGMLQIAVRDLFTPGGDGEETYPLSGDEVDLEPLVHDAVLLELPVAPLCGADCGGLCPTCGAHRDGPPCTCEPVFDSRWSALDVLRVPDTGFDRDEDETRN